MFAKQPYSVTGNVYNIEDDPVLGFFQVASVAFKRLYVNNEDLEDLDLSEYSYPCELEKVYMDSLTRGVVVYDTLYEIYNGEVINGDYNM